MDFITANPVLFLVVSVVSMILGIALHIKNMNKIFASNFDFCGFIPGFVLIFLSNISFVLSLFGIVKYFIKWLINNW